MLIYYFRINAEVVLIGSIYRAIFGLFFIKTKLLDHIPNRLLGRPLYLHKSWNPRPRIDADFDLAKLPNFSFCFLFGFHF